MDTRVSSAGLRATLSSSGLIGWTTRASIGATASARPTARREVGHEVLAGWASCCSELGLSAQGHFLFSFSVILLAIVLYLIDESNELQTCYKILCGKTESIQGHIPSFIF